jgi:O-succinylbenzoate synthase
MGNFLIKLDDFQVSEFLLRVKAPFQTKKGLLLYAKTVEGKGAFAEVSPLLRFSLETLEEAKNQLESLRKEILDSPLDVLQQKKLLPSVAFGLDSLIYSLSCNNSPDSYPLCGFLSGTFKEMQDEIPFLINEGYKHIKIKVSKLSFDEAHQVIEKLLAKAVLKIDVNRIWSLKESLSFFSRYPLDTFEYIEEPVSDIKDLAYFPYPIALDETLRENGPIPSLPNIKAFIIKPMLTGGLKEIQKLLDLAHLIKASVTLSSSYESGVGLFHLCSLLKRAKIPVHPLGVDTHRLLKQDILLKPHMIANGILTLSPLEVLDASAIIC